MTIFNSKGVFMNRINAWTTYNATQLKAVDKFADQYKVFLDNSKTEREAIDTIVNEIEAAGYRELNTLIGGKTKLKKGDKVYSVWMNKSIAMFQNGSDPMEAGMNILGAHIDSPRLDVKQNPVYEKDFVVLTVQPFSSMSVRMRMILYSSYQTFLFTLLRTRWPRRLLMLSREKPLILS